MFTVGVAFVPGVYEGGSEGGGGAGGGQLILQFGFATYVPPDGGTLILQFDNLTYTPPLSD